MCVAELSGFMAIQLSWATSGTHKFFSCDVSWASPTTPPVGTHEVTI
jgi:hypothetical protein